ncbi:hypothetical protein H257_18076 [Aphanomyces astaci]|uniref:MULE transposase domain-containing protein n=1 Tax=Aphanomyces astaci TaxID=112090 RepID=W4FE22_APHAT|nr:hypothetical protein H257_18076 [Aphanomyces astaci]ETV65119.1 hypothetical protein H257_18076 [Aphanomyces astaci]|eukprot:XP_009845388.1 hypothetical protein H257_18076 [Aphanomyces astaci]
MQYLEKSPAIFSTTLAIAGVRYVQNVVLVLSQLLKSMSGVQYTFDLTHSAECVMDSTHKTNASGFELYALLVPFRGQGAEVKVAYLQRWLALLRDDFGLHPAFVHMDKDSAQIAAATAVWTGVKLYLCLWHMDRAIQARFMQGKVFPDIRRFAPTNTLLHVEGYTPAFPAVWVHGTHVLEESFCDKAVLGPLLSLMKSHYKAHPFMSMHDDAMPPHDKARVFYIRAVEEIYNFCNECSASYLFVYLFNNWYSENEFKRWARSQCPTALATLRTSMMAEAHFNCLKTFNDHDSTFFALSS